MMGQFVVKAARDEDLYLLWSTVVDNAIWVGARAELIDHLMATGNYPTRDVAEKRVARADEKGTSALDVGWFDWTDETFTVANVDGGEHAFYELARDRLSEYARALLSGDDAALLSVLTPRPIEEDS